MKKFYYTTNTEITQEMVANAELATISKNHKIGMDGRPINQIYFNEIGWFEFQTTAHVVDYEEGVAYDCFFSTDTNKLYKVACQDKRETEENVHILLSLTF